MIIYAYILISVFAVSCVSLIGILTMSMMKEKLQKMTILLVSFATGSLFGGSFLHLIPETYEHMGIGLKPSLFIVAGFLMFFVLEKILRWRHCHLHSDDHFHPFVVTNLVGDGMHNLIDGMLIASSFLVDVNVGIATTLAVLFHEIPQEIGDFGVLIHGGLSVKKAVIFNFVSALLAVLGAILIIVSHEYSERFSVYLIPITAGGFLYIAGSDLIPELHHENDIKKSCLQLLMIVLGIGMMVMLEVLGPSMH